MMRILHISDIHYSEDYFRCLTMYSPLMDQMEEPFTQLRQLMGNKKPDYDLVLCSGDICEYGTTEEYRRTRDRLQQYFGCPVLVTGGNHDILANLMEGFSLSAKDGELFEAHYFDDLRVICLNSSDADHNDGFISEKSCDLLEEELQNEFPATIIMTHHHLIPEQFSLPAACYPERLRTIIREAKVTAVITGHTHHFWHGLFEGKEYFTTGSLSFVVDPDESGKLLFYEGPSAIEYTLTNGRLEYNVLRTETEGRKIGYLPI